MGQVLDAKRSSFCFSVSGAAGSDWGLSATPVAAAPTVLKKSRRFDMLKAYSYRVTAISYRLSAISLGVVIGGERGCRGRRRVWRGNWVRSVEGISGSPPRKGLRLREEGRRRLRFRPWRVARSRGGGGGVRLG